MFVAASTSVVLFAAGISYFAAVVLPKMLADNSPPYVDLQQTAIKSNLVAGGKFCYYATAKNRRDCASVSGQHIFRSGDVEFRTSWTGTAKPGPVVKGSPWCATAPQVPGVYSYFWTGQFVGCKGASYPLLFQSDPMAVKVDPKPIPPWTSPTVRQSD